MRRHSKIRKAFVEYLQGELTANETADVGRHLEHCHRCREECATLKDALQAIPVPQASPADRQPAEYWNTFAHRVENRLAEQNRHPARVRSILHELRTYLQPRWKPILVSAGAGAVLATAVFLWLAGGRDRQPGVPGSQDVDVVQAAHRDDINDYFERSRILLIGIANIPADEKNKIDLSVERSAARDLLHTARYLEQKPIDSRSRELIRELERVLVELANLEDEVDVPEVDVIRTGLQQQNLLFKIRMAENRKR